MIITQKVAEIMLVGDATEGTWIEGEDWKIRAKSRTLENVNNDRMGRGRSCAQDQGRKVEKYHGIQ